MKWRFKDLDNYLKTFFTQRTNRLHNRSNTTSDRDVSGASVEPILGIVPTDETISSTYLNFCLASQTSPMDESRRAAGRIGTNLGA